MLVRIATFWDTPDLRRQTPGETGTWGDLQVTRDAVPACDLLLVLTVTPVAVTVDVPPGRAWCLFQEPPVAALGWIRPSLAQFDRVISPGGAFRGATTIDDQPALAWHVGRTYDQLRGSPPPRKSRNLSWVTSNLTSLRGHRRRIRLLHRLLAAAVPLDLFGRGFNPIPDKWDALAPYRYSLAVENEPAPGYWTEKIADCFLAGCMPLYCGAPDLSRWFPPDSFVAIDRDDPATPRLIREIIRSDLAERRRDAILEARRRVLEEHQFFPQLARWIAASPPPPPDAPRRTVTIQALPPAWAASDRPAWLERTLALLRRARTRVFRRNSARP